MADGVGEGRSESPPTDRTVAVIELLALEDGSYSVAQVADTLELSRSTVASILTALEERGWVIRLPDLRYQIGPAVVRIAERARTRLPAPEGMASELDALAERVGCGAALSVVSATHLVFVGITQGRGRIPAAIEIGARVPLRAPVGSTVVAHASQSMQVAWLDTVPTDWREDFTDALEQIRLDGFSVWGLDPSNVDAIEVIADVAEYLTANPGASRLRDRTLGLLTSLSLRPYLSDTLGGHNPLPVSYLAAPVFDSRGQACWELQIGPLRAAVSRSERETYIHELCHAATLLSGKEQFDRALT